jgi:sulfur-carrier protein
VSTVHVQYYAILREQARTSRETLATGAATAAALYAELTARHGFTLSATLMKVAINGEFAAWDAALKDGDEVVFIPPVAGG